MRAIPDEPVRCEELKKLRRLYDGLTDKHPDFSDRLETQVLEQGDGGHVQNRREPHGQREPGRASALFRSCNADWTANFYFVQEYGEYACTAAAKDISPK